MKSFQDLQFSRYHLPPLSPGCSLGIGDWRILRLLRIILQLNFACSLKELCFFYNNSPVTLHYSPAITILNENPAFTEVNISYFLTINNRTVQSNVLNLFFLQDLRNPCLSHCFPKSSYN